MKRLSTFHFAFLLCGGQVETHPCSVLCLHSEELWALVPTVLVLSLVLLTESIFWSDVSTVSSKNVHEEFRVKVGASPCILYADLFKLPSSRLPSLVGTHGLSRYFFKKNN